MSNIWFSEDREVMLDLDEVNLCMWREAERDDAAFEVGDRFLAVWLDSAGDAESFDLRQEHGEELMEALAEKRDGEAEVVLASAPASTQNPEHDSIYLKLENLETTLTMARSEAQGGMSRSAASRMGEALKLVELLRAQVLK